jgi:hypothetical protein
MIFDGKLATDPQYKGKRTGYRFTVSCYERRLTPVYPHKLLDNHPSPNNWWSLTYLNHEVLFDTQGGDEVPPIQMIFDGKLATDPQYKGKRTVNAGVSS